MSDDKRHLDLLSIFHYIYAAIMALGICFPMIYVGIGFALASNLIPDADKEPSAKFIEIAFIAVGTLMILLMLAFAITVFFSARCLKRRQGYIYCLVISSLMLLNMPLGTCLGIFTLCVLLRPGVQALFEESLLPDDEVEIIEEHQSGQI